jgi:hypothetical protein
MRLGKWHGGALAVSEDRLLDRRLGDDLLQLERQSAAIAEAGQAVGVGCTFQIGLSSSPSRRRPPESRAR